MRIKFALICSLLGLALAANQARSESLVDGDAAAGKAKSVTCAACHGNAGISVSPLWPNIAGQSAPYLVSQLQAFKQGRRQNPLMSSQAMTLTDADMRNLAVYYESLPMAAQPVAEPDLVDRAQALYRGGHVENNVPACIACHGPTGRGIPAAAYPAVNGQHSAYTAKTLSDYASGERKSDGTTQIMRSIAERLSQADILALASYLQGLK